MTRDAEPRDVGSGAAPEAHHDTLIAVYGERGTAEAVMRSVVDMGAQATDVRIDVPGDETESLVAEMQEEANRAIVAPPAGVVYPREASRSMVVLGLPIVLLCVLVALPLSIVGMGGLVLWQRMLVVGLIGAVSGLAITAVVGPAMGAKRANEPLAAQRGTVLRVDNAGGAILAVMASAEPIRLDRVDESGQVVSAEPITTEELSAGLGILEEIKRNAADPLHENDPGYTPGDRPGGAPDGTGGGG